MDVLPTFILLLQTMFWSAVAAFPVAVVLRLLLPFLPKPRGIVWRFIVGGVYLLLFFWLAHFAYFLDYYSCVRMPKVPGYEFECVGDPLGVSLSLSFQVILGAAPYMLLFYSAAFFVYRRINLKSEFLRLYVASLMFIVVMLLWLAVFPWTLEHYLQRFY